MKKTFAFSIFGLMFTPVAFGATPWWERGTICQISPTDCYSHMGTGYDTELWDTTDKCWGMKLICPDALIATEYAPVPVSRSDIRAGNKIKSDFDTDELNGDCFGVRKTVSNGAMAMVNGKYVQVWCNDVPLDSPDEYLPNGVITYADAPTCAELAEYGYVASENKKCYGKYYDPAQYYIKCSGDNLLPERIVVLNGADYTMASSDMPADKSAAEDMFDKMESISQKQRSKYFSDN